MASSAGGGPAKAAAAAPAAPGREKERLFEGTKHSMASSGKIGGAFVKTTSAPYLQHRIDVFDRIYAAQEEKVAAEPHVAITVTLPDGTTKSGTSWQTTPLDIATGISKGLANDTVVAKVKYSKRHGSAAVAIHAVEDEEEDDHGGCCGHGAGDDGELWDMTRPLEGDCALKLFKFDTPEGQSTYWHSSAHMLGECMETMYGVHLCIGPPVQNGFYYDCYMGTESVKQTDFKAIEKTFMGIAKQKQPFQRVVLTKAQALDMFKHNPFKQRIITTKVPDAGMTTAYRCGPLIDLCMGPHVPHTGKVKAFSVQKNASSYWLADAENDSLQRVYGVTFPSKKQMAQHKKFLEQAQKYDHRKVGEKQELFFFHDLSPGSCFFLPHGARLYNNLMDFIKREYRRRGYTEVISPNMYNADLWRQSGHWQHYQDDMFTFKVEGADWALKPMNCPGHCLMFAHRVRSWRELPLRLADFGVLHRNELSGALSGLTRVRRFQQDDAHIFCRADQVKQEVLGALDFMQHVYGVFGMTFALERSTRPKKAVGVDTAEGCARWDNAEAALAEALDEFAGKGKWKDNPGDGAFYGPKIDIKVLDCMKRVHQCATVQLDFNLPIRFNLRYKGKDENGGENGDGFERPVMVHRAMLGSVERMIAILTEHFRGKWPFWLSPRQALVVPIHQNLNAYAHEVQRRLHDAGFHADVDESTKTFNKKIREGQLAQYNFILVVGQGEHARGTVNVRTRDNKVRGEKTLADLVWYFEKLQRDKHAFDGMAHGERDPDAADGGGADGGDAKGGKGKGGKQKGGKQQGGGGKKGGKQKQQQSKKKAKQGRKQAQKVWPKEVQDQEKVLFQLKKDKAGGEAIKAAVMKLNELKKLHPAVMVAPKPAAPAAAAAAAEDGEEKKK